jgi:hypothetical protein
VPGALPEAAELREERADISRLMRCTLGPSSSSDMPYFACSAASSTVPVVRSMCCISRMRRRRALCLARRSRQERLEPSKAATSWNLPHCWQKRCRRPSLITSIAFRWGSQIL